VIPLCHVSSRSGEACCKLLYSVYILKSKVKFSNTRYRALGPELIPVYKPSADRCLSHPPGARLPLLSARPAVTFPTEECHRPSAGCTKLYCLETGAHECEQLIQGGYAYLEADQQRFEPATYWIASERSTVTPHGPLRIYYLPNIYYTRAHRSSSC